MDRLRRSSNSSNNSSSGDTAADSDSITSGFPILGDNVSPVTPDRHPSMQQQQQQQQPHSSQSSIARAPRFSFRASASSTTTSKRRLGSTTSPLSQPQFSSSLSSSSSSPSPSSLSMSTSSLPSSSSLTDRLTMMKIPMQDLKGAVFYGWLWKRGHTFKTWKKRFFLLNGAALTYYKQCCVITWDILGGGIRCLDLPVRGGLRVAQAEASDLTSFGLRITSSSGRLLYVQAGDLESRTQWLKVLKDAPQRRAAQLGQEPLRQTMVSDLSSRRSCQLNDTQSPSMHSGDSIGEVDGGERGMQGYLTIRGGLLSGWKKRYVTLQKGHLVLKRSHVVRRSVSSESKESTDKQLEVLSAAAWTGHVNGLCIRLANHKEMFAFADHDVDATMWLTALKSC